MVTIVAATVAAITANDGNTGASVAGRSVAVASSIAVARGSLDISGRGGRGHVGGLHIGRGGHGGSNVGG